MKKLISFLKITEENMAYSKQDLVEKMKEIDLREKVENLLIEKEKELPLTKEERRN